MFLGERKILIDGKEKLAFKLLNGDIVIDNKIVNKKFDNLNNEVLEILKVLPYTHELYITGKERKIVGHGFNGELSQRTPWETISEPIEDIESFIEDLDVFSYNIIDIDESSKQNFKEDIVKYNKKQIPDDDELYTYISIFMNKNKAIIEVEKYFQHEFDYDGIDYEDIAERILSDMSPMEVKKDKIITYYGVMTTTKKKGNIYKILNLNELSKHFNYTEDYYEFKNNYHPIEKELSDGDGLFIPKALFIIKTKEKPADYNRVLSVPEKVER